MRTMRMLFFAALVLSCKPAAPQNAPPPDIDPPVFGEAVKLCGVTVYQEHPGQEIDIIGSNSMNAVVSVASVGYSAVTYLAPMSKTAINAHLVRGEKVTIRIELIEFDDARDGMEKCKPATVTVK